MVNLGILVALTLGYFWSYKSMWRAIFAMAGIIGVLQGLGLFIVPESPEWLAHTGELEMARRVLQRIRGTATYTEEEIARWSTGGDSIGKSESLVILKSVTWIKLLTSPTSGRTVSAQRS